MPRFFFHVHDGKENVDPEGVELQSSDKAHAEAMAAAGDMLKDIDGKFKQGRWTMRVEDGDGDKISEITVIVDRPGLA